MEELTKDMINEDIELLSRKLKKLRKQKRSDCGVKRGAYNSHLPKDFRSYILRANKKGIEFSLSLDDFNNILSKDCIFCGSFSKMTIDRINSKLGYSLENTQPACYMCNLMKYTHSQEQFLNQVKKINRFLNFDK